jgi:hypothetical protein
VDERSIACVSHPAPRCAEPPSPKIFGRGVGLTGGIDFVENSKISSFRQNPTPALFCGILIPQLTTIGAVFRRAASNSLNGAATRDAADALATNLLLTFYTSRICTAAGSIQVVLRPCVTPADRLPRWRTVATTLARDRYTPNSCRPAARRKSTGSGLVSRAPSAPEADRSFTARRWQGSPARCQGRSRIQPTLDADPPADQSPARQWRSPG